MSTIGVSWSVLRNSATMASVSRIFWPAFSARSDAAWIAGPSAIGSENGMPSSMRSAPALRQAEENLLRGLEIADRRP